MHKKETNPFLSILPKLDVHGETSDSVMTFVNDFINYNYKINKKKIYVIHGHNGKILKTTIHKNLQKNKLVKNYYTDYENEGITIIELK